jgi:hypothetical protein
MSLDNEDKQPIASVLAESDSRMKAFIVHLETTLVNPFRRLSSPMDPRTRTREAIRPLDLEANWPADRLARLTPRH